MAGTNKYERLETTKMNAQRFIGWLDAMGVKLSSVAEKQLQENEREFNKEIGGKYTVFEEIKSFVADTCFQGDLSFPSESIFVDFSEAKFVFMLKEWVCFCDEENKKLYVVKAKY